MVSFERGEKKKMGEKVGDQRGRKGDALRPLISMASTMTLQDRRNLSTCWWGEKKREELKLKDEKKKGSAALTRAASKIFQDQKKKKLVILITLFRKQEEGEKKGGVRKKMRGLDDYAFTIGKKRVGKILPFFLRRKEEEGREV